MSLNEELLPYLCIFIIFKKKFSEAKNFDLDDCMMPYITSSISVGHFIN